MRNDVPHYGTNGVQSLERAMDILTYVAANDRPSLSDVCRDLGLKKTTAHRLLSFLHSRRVLERDHAGCYWIGPAISELSRSVSKQRAFGLMVLPFLQELRDETNETASFRFLVGRYHVCIEQAVSRHELRREVEMQKAVPLGMGSAGKAILAFLPEAERQAAIRAWNSCCSPRIDPKTFGEQLRDIRARGTSLSLGERVAGTATVSAPVFDRSGQVVGTVSLSGPDERFSLELIQVYAERLKELAARISSRLGYRPLEEVTS